MEATAADVPCAGELLSERRDKNGLQKARFHVVHSAFTGTTHMYSASHRAITFSPTFPNWKSGRQIIAHNQFPMSINVST